MSNTRTPLSDITNVSRTASQNTRRHVREQNSITLRSSNVIFSPISSPPDAPIVTPAQLRAKTARDKRKTFSTKKRTGNVSHVFSQFNPPTRPLSSTATGEICSPTDVVERLVRDLCAEYGESLNEVLPSITPNEETSYWEGYWDIGDPDYECEKCRAQMWFEERKQKSRGTRRPKFSLCCSDGKVVLPYLHEPPEILKSLLNGHHRLSKHFRENIRGYNSMFSFTSMGGKIDHSINQGRGPYTFRMGGQNVHRIGTLVPPAESSPKFCQLYIYDTEEEVYNRKTAISPNDPSRFNDGLIRLLKNMIDQYNPLAKLFRMVRDKLSLDKDSEVSIRLISRREKDGRTYNRPTVSEIAALIEGDIGPNMEKRDIIVKKSCGGLQRISELHPLYTPLQYPLLFPSGDDGYRLGIQHGEASIGVSTSEQPCEETTCREWFAYRLQDRSPDIEFPTLLLSGKAFHQFLVDGYMMVESHRLNYIRFNQERLRVDNYKNLSNAVGRGDIEPSSAGARYIIPSSFPGGDKWKKVNYLDTMTICKWFGYPDLFITFTCNPKWPEIVRFVTKRGLRSEDRPDILCRVFKIKLDELIRDLKDRHIFGKVRAVVYTIEFQKRGLPHAHILLFLHREYKFPEAADVDKIISAEIPDPIKEPILHAAVCEYMLHGPCGKEKLSSPCMVGENCSKHYPKPCTERTTVDGEGYPIYKRSKKGVTVKKDDVPIGNEFVIPYNAQLLLKYRAHINVEWCNQSRSIKYLFKYINKGSDRVTMQSSYMRRNEDDPGRFDEIKRYYDCRYLSACEAAWRLFGFEIHYRTPAVERLQYHLPDEQPVIFDDDDFIDDVVDKSSMGVSQFLNWMACNNSEQPDMQISKEFLYSQFPTKFVWKKKERHWSLRKKGFTIGRLVHVPPNCGELYFMRIMLNHVKGPKCFEDIRTVDEYVCPTFREACYKLGLIGDDREYIDAIKQAADWGSGFYLLNLFSTLLRSHCLCRPQFGKKPDSFYPTIYFIGNANFLKIQPYN
ncbi:uncharacterized protein LOC141600710 [Silene latifolia]|uniref:uncharacterized protein LOC141600710 n=1 Tax=Silene latifolia TaxID=37657 RepID=UPI003D77E55A